MHDVMHIMKHNMMHYMMHNIMHNTLHSMMINLMHNMINQRFAYFMNLKLNTQTQSQILDWHSA